MEKVKVSSKIGFSTKSEARTKNTEMYVKLKIHAAEGEHVAIHLQYL